MARFRRNHGDGKVGGTSTYVRAAVFGVCIVGLIYLLQGGLGGLGTAKGGGLTEDSGVERLYLPTAADGWAVIHHTEYSLAYVEEHELAAWVAYELTEDKLRVPNVDRTDYFEEDDAVYTRSARHSDYTRSGYSRGHLAPAGDMAHDIVAMEESFYMSNIAPQLRAFNGGVWKELEEQVRDWAYLCDRVLVVTGPVLTDGPYHKIGRNKVSVPKYFYKVILDVDGPERKAIAFVIPNESSDLPLQSYAQSIDVVETLTGIDFFADLLSDEIEDQLESSLDVSLWTFSDKRYQQRINRWNKQ